MLFLVIDIDFTSRMMAVLADGSTRGWRDHLYRDCSPVASEKQINNFLQKASSGAFDRMNSNYPAYPDLFWRPPETFEISPVLLGRYAISL